MRALVFVFLAVLTVLTVAPCQTFRVIAMTPRGIGASTAAPIRLTFTESVQTTTVTAKVVRVFGKWSGVVPGVLKLDGSGKQLTFEPSRPYFPHELVTIHVSNSLKSTSNKPLVTGFFGAFLTTSSRGSRSFKLVKTIAMRRSGEGGIATYGIHAGDLDGDGSPDITAANEHSFDLRLFRNNGCGEFGPPTRISATKQQISPTTGADFNGDGVLDLASGNMRAKAMSVFLGDGKGSFNAPTIYPTGGDTHGIGALDADSDGHMDIVAPNTSKIALFLNDGTGKFKSPKFFETGGSGENNVGVGDANGDGIADLFVGNYNSGNIVLLLGDGVGGFKVSATRSCGGRSFHIAVGDVDGDGNLDAVTVNLTSHTLGLVRGDGKGGLYPVVTYPVGNTPVSVDLGDLDGDGWLDCVVSSYGSSDYTIYWNDGKGKFINRMSLPSTKAASCATLVDFDRDGDVDIIGTDEEADEARLYVQTEPTVSGAQPKTCGAALRVNNLARLAGYGSLPDVPLDRGANVFFGVSGPATTTYAIGVGLGVRPGGRLPFGIYNLAVTPGVIVLFLGTTNAFGEASTAMRVPAGLSIGVRVALQALVTDSSAPAGALLTNPEWVVTR